MKVELRDVEKADIAIFYDQQNDAGAHRMVGITSHAPDDKKAYFKKWEKIFPDENVTKRTILSDGRVAGIINCFYAPWSEKQEVGYWIGREFWGKGIASKALAEFLKIEYRRPLFATVASHNKASIVVLQKCGFKQIATDKVKLDDGREISECRFNLGLLASESDRTAAVQSKKVQGSMFKVCSAKVNSELGMLASSFEFLVSGF